MQNITLITEIPNSRHQLAIPYSKNGLDMPAGLAEVEREQLEIFGADQKPGAAARLPYANGSLLVIGADSTASKRDFAAAARRQAKSTAPLVIHHEIQTESDVHALVEGLILGESTPTSYKKSSASSFEIMLLVPASFADLDITKPQRVSEIVVSIREIVNMPANDLFPEALVELAKNLTKDLPIALEVWDEARLEKEGCGGISSVGKGSVRPPRMAKLEYRGGGKHLALVGKGITFDTGGLSLKPPEGMVGMKYDMAGAATILGAITAIATLGLEVNVTAYMCIAENMPSGNATRPGDVIKIRNGKTVEVLNTDAEGRLVLADGLSLAQETNPDHIIDVATLTGAATIALGTRYAGLMGHGDAINLVKQAASIANEQVWEMPLPEELRPLLDSEIADMANVKIGNRAGGMLIGGHFLADFVNPETSWAHLDIAGPANNDGAPYSVIPKGASGVMIRTLVETARLLETS